MEEPSDKTKTDKTENGYIKKGGNGGYRDGCGRKPKEKLPGKFNARELFYKKVDDRWDMIMKAMDGWIEDKDKEAVKWMVEQRIGKAPTSVSLELSGTVATEKIERDLQNLLYDKGLGENTEGSANSLQDRGGRANDANREPVQDISVNSPTETTESMAECSHEVREILDGSVSSADESN